MCSLLGFFQISSSFLRTRNLHNLLNNQVQRLALNIVGGFVVDLFAFSAAGDKTAGFQEFKVMGDSRAGHAHQGRDIDNTLLTMAEKPENLDSAAIAKLPEHVGNCLKVGFLKGALQVFYIVFICVMMREHFFGHYIVSLQFVVDSIITHKNRLDKSY